MVIRHLSLSLLLSVAIYGCGSETGEIVKTVPVSGTATFQGKPLPQGYQILFVPPEGRAANATTDDSGKFVLGTNSEGDGAIVGTHNVAVLWSPPVTEEAGQEDFTKPAPRPPVKLPAKFSDPKASGVTVEVPPEGLTDYKLELE